MNNKSFILNHSKSLAILCRLIIGSIFLISGLDGFYSFLPLPPTSSQGAQFLNALKDTGYFYQFLKGIETCCGLLLVSNFFVPLALMVLIPIIVNILLYGIFLDQSTLFVPFIVLACSGYLVWYYRDLFKIFVKYQFMTSPDTEGKAHILVLEERTKEEFNINLRPLIK